MIIARKIYMIEFKMPAGIYFYIKFLLGLNVLLQLRWIKTFYVSQSVCWKNIMFNIDVNEYSYLGIKFITLCKF